MGNLSFSMRAVFVTSVAVLLLTMLMPGMSVPARAEPEWGPFEPWVSFKVTASGIHFVKDPLVEAATLPAPAPGPPPLTPTSPPTVSGSVRFVCADDRVPPRVPRGFQYHIVVEGLSPKTAYMAMAYPLPGSQDYPAVTPYELGTIHTNAKGDGRFSGFIDLDAGPFNYQITVELVFGTAILTTLPAFTYYDPSLNALPFPFPVGSFLWGFGDHVDGFVAG